MLWVHPSPQWPTTFNPRCYPLARILQQVCELLLRSLAERGRYDELDFCCRLDDLLGTLDGTAEGGRYTDVAMREVWRARRREGRPWGQAAGWSNTSEAAQRAVVLAARCAAAALCCCCCLLLLQTSERYSGIFTCVHGAAAAVVV